VVTTAQPLRRGWRYWLRLLAFFVLTLVTALFGLPFLLGVLTMFGLTHPPCWYGSDPGQAGMPYEAVRFPSTNNIIQEGYFIPGTERATVIVVPTFNKGRGGELYYARVFHDAGFNVLTMNARVCTSQGWISLGYQEVADVRAAYAYLQTRSDVDPTRVGLHGFSSAGATSIMAAAQMPEIRAVSAEGGYHDYAAVLELNQSSNFVIRLYQYGAALTYRLVTGDDVQILAPINMLDKLAPRSLLLVYGSREVSLPGARLMLARALASDVPAALWVIDGADHGGYLEVAPAAFVERVVGFHRRALLDEPNKE
jgi:hypothetical protein